MLNYLANFQLSVITELLDSNMLCLNSLAERKSNLQTIFLSMYGCVALVDLGRFFSFLIHTQSVGLGQGISPSEGLYLNTKQHNHIVNADRHPWRECSSGRRRFMSYAARPLWSAPKLLVVIIMCKVCRPDLNEFYNCTECFVAYFTTLSLWSPCGVIDASKCWR
jgi:hypothetical protein